MNKFKLGELFTGTGAFSLAFEKTEKVETVFANDFCKNSEKIFNENFKSSIFGEVRFSFSNSKFIIKRKII
jgi:site-specific DNA-cytosine methylase